ncbi:MAG: hypothetical protein QF472_03975 [Candidatus Marinimicrobia bacterium]|nr:hypothetical protein [Candidatus Neomarinimicrobiota bacterium]
MIRCFTILLFGIGLCRPQSDGLSLYGAGGHVKFSSPASIGLGNGNFFSGNHKNISMDSPSSLWRSALTQFSIHSGATKVNSGVLSEQFQQNLTRFSLFFPVGNKKVFGMGIRPLYRSTSTEVNEEDFNYLGANESITGSPIAYRSNYKIRGGLSEIFLTFSFKMNDNLSFGLENNFIFGNYFYTDEIYTYDVHFDTTYTTNIELGQFQDGEEPVYASGTNVQRTVVDKDYLMRGNSVTLEGRFTTAEHEIVANTSFTGNFRYAYKKTQVFENSSSTVEMPMQSFSEPGLTHIGLGYHYKAGGHWGITTELHRQNALSSFPGDAALFGVEMPNESSLHLGSYYQFINSKIGFWNNLNLRTGLYYKTLSFAEGDFKDYGAAIGIGFELLNNTQSIDFALKTGTMESIIQKGILENYISLHVGITTGEKWFMKRRRK